MTEKKHKKKVETPADEQLSEEAQPQEQTKMTVEEKLTAERDDLLGRLQRTAADYSNYQKRMSRQMSEAVSYANNDLIKAMLPVMDDMERALEASANDAPMRQGMQLVHDKALDVLSKYGLTIIEAEGKEFDPELHAAILHQPTDEYPPHTVIQEVQRGYQLKGRTIRPSQVVVAKGNSQED